MSQSSFQFFFFCEARWDTRSGRIGLVCFWGVVGSTKRRGRGGRLVMLGRRGGTTKR